MISFRPARVPGSPGDQLVLWQHPPCGTVAVATANRSPMEQWKDGRCPMPYCPEPIAEAALLYVREEMSERDSALAEQLQEDAAADHEAERYRQGADFHG